MSTIKSRPIPAQLRVGSSMPGPLTVTDASVKRLIQPSEAISLTRKAYIKFARHEALSPERLVFPIPEKNTLFIMPAHVLGEKTVSIKVARLNPRNPLKRLPSVTATLYVYDSNTGREIARIEVEELTAIRTAASSAVATDQFASSSCDTLGIIGTGKQARAHVPALMQVRKFSRILVHSRNKERRRKFAREIHKKHGIKVEPIDSPDEVASASQVLVLATNSSTPLFNGRLVKPGTHVNAIGSALPSTREVDTELVARSFLVVDSIPQALSTYGDIMIPIKQKRITRRDLNQLGDLLTQPLRKRRHHKVSLFKSGGIAALDAVFADHIVAKLAR